MRSEALMYSNISSDIFQVIDTSHTVKTDQTNVN